ncbi:MAG: hypothetical protein NDI73_01620 [Desulfuromonadales bacterium]|nr:hypothetical protein [Desulfuromonadales bacterium]
MTISVELLDGCCVRVVPRGLDLLLNRKLVRRFLRSSGWAVVGVDPIRLSPHASEYHGRERRLTS